MVDVVHSVLPDLDSEDLLPLYPTPAHLIRLLSPNSGLTTNHRVALVRHCLTRACIFGDIQLLRFILQDSSSQAFIDLDLRDEDGISLVTLAIVNFTNESDRDVEREECIRLLITEGADVNATDNAGWSPLHHAALFAPPTLISFLITHGSSPLIRTNRKLTPHDIVTAYSMVPGREDVASLLEEAMRAEGWEGSRVIQQRHEQDTKTKQAEAEKAMRDGIDRILELDGHWWKDEDEYIFIHHPEEFASEDSLYTPPADYTSMLVFSPNNLAKILDAVITNFRPSIHNAEPANALYMLTRFACLTCDETWIEDLIIRATDSIENAVFNRPDDLTTLIFWIYNSTIWLHLLRCDNTTSEICDSLESFNLIEEVIGSIFVFLIRFAERRIDKLLDYSLLDYAPESSEYEAQFESEWSFFRSAFAGKKRIVSVNNNTPPATISRSTLSSSTSRPLSPTTTFNPSLSPTASRSLSTLSNSLSRARAPSLNGLLRNGSSAENRTPEDITTFLTALHTLMSISGVNPTLIMQLWSQTMYWTSCEIFNRILTRKRYLCRSRALQIGMNLSSLEEWMRDSGLPRAIEAHFAPVRELLHWLQCLSSMSEFSDIVATIQSLKHLNPLQMRRAMRDYRYEVKESRMNEDCSQYLMQLQKDWERQRVSLGVQAFRKEIGGDRDAEDTSSIADSQANPESANNSFDVSPEQKSLDQLFDRAKDKSEWAPPQAPSALGELLDSRYMFPLLFPTDPKMLSTTFDDLPGYRRRSFGQAGSSASDVSGLVSRQSAASGQASPHARGSMEWCSSDRKLREVNIQILQRVA